VLVGDRKLAEISVITGVLAEPAKRSVSQAAERGDALGTASRQLEAPSRVCKVVGHPRR
jgi:hypothetical protein